MRVYKMLYKRERKVKLHKQLMTKINAGSKWMLMGPLFKAGMFLLCTVTKSKSVIFLIHTM